MAETKFLFDAMLGRLVRLVRAAGYDAALAGPGEADVVLRRRAREEGRLLVTRDRDLARNASGAILLETDSLEDQAVALAGASALDWLKAPFTRCMVDNTPLQPATAEELQRMPRTAIAMPGSFNSCPGCGRLYWPGSHVRRLQEQLLRLSLRPPG